MSKKWNADGIGRLMRSYQPACIIAAAADLDLFDTLAPKPLTAEQAARKLDADSRGMTVLLDALVALQLLDKRGDRYSVPESVARVLTSRGSQSVLAMAQHQANCMRRWVQFAEVVKSGRSVARRASIRGEEADAAAFIGAMHAVNVAAADGLVSALKLPPFRHLLDVGGASGTWTIAFLRAHPKATATLFDLPHVIPMAQRRLADAGLRGRVKLVAGDFGANALPSGADLAWVSAIVHQNSRAQNRKLFAKVLRALVPGGHIAIRDIVMDKSRTKPVGGALFAVNMLTATEGGGTFTFDELRDDLISAGFIRAALLRRDEGMNSVVVARKPKAR